MFIWKLKPILTAEIDIPTFVKKSKKARLSSVWIKVADGEVAYENIRDSMAATFKSVRDALAAERIGIWGWHVPHGLDTPTAAKEAKLVAKIARRFGLAGILMDAEAEANFFRGTEAEASLYRLFAACSARYSWQDTRDL